MLSREVTESRAQSRTHCTCTHYNGAARSPPVRRPFPLALNHHRTVRTGQTQREVNTQEFQLWRLVCARTSFCAGFASIRLCFDARFDDNSRSRTVTRL